MRFGFSGRSVIKAIKEAEKRTSAEIRVAVRRKLADEGVDAARKVFGELGMHETAHRNGVLILVDTDRKGITVFGDDGIYEAAGHDAFAGVVRIIESEFAGGRFTDGLVKGIAEIGEHLKKHFPYEEASDRNELSDGIDRK